VNITTIEDAKIITPVTLFLQYKLFNKLGLFSLFFH